jgi:hypothetical protein
MNREQRICLWAGIAMFVLMGLWPPWHRVRAPEQYRYGFLVVPPGTRLSAWFFGRSFRMGKMRRPVLSEGYMGNVGGYKQ